MPSSNEVRAGGAYVEVFAKDNTAAGLGKAEASLDKLRESFGRGSVFTQFGKLLSGAGPVIGLTLIGRALADVTGKAVELRDEFNSGEKSIGQITDELLRQLPVLGNIYTAGRNIRELITGEAAGLKDVYGLVFEIDRLTKSRSEAMAGFVDDLAAIGAVTQQLRVAGLLIGTKDPWRSWLEAQAEAVKQQHELIKTLEETKAKIRDRFKVEIEVKTFGAKGEPITEKAKIDAEAYKKQLEKQLGDINIKLMNPPTSTHVIPIPNSPGQTRTVEGPDEGAIHELGRQRDQIRQKLSVISQNVTEMLGEIGKATSQTDASRLQNAKNFVATAGDIIGNFLNDFGAAAWRQAGESLQAMRDAAKKWAEFLDVLHGQDAAIEDSINSMFKDLQQRGDRIRQLVQTPLEKLKENLAEIDDLFNLGAIDAETASRARDKFQEAFDAAEAANRRLSSAGTFNSGAARGLLGTDLVDEQRVTNDLLRRIERKFPTSVIN